MKDKFAVSMFGQKRLSREGGIEIVVKELCTRMARNGCQVTCYNRSGHHVSGAEYDNKIEYDGIRQKFVPTIERHTRMWMPIFAVVISLNQSWTRRKDSVIKLSVCIISKKKCHDWITFKKKVMC